MSFLPNSVDFRRRTVPTAGSAGLNERASVATLIYSAITSVDGYVEDAAGSFAWATPDEEVHTFVNGLERTVGTYLYGRRMYETMVYWEGAHTIPDLPAFTQDYATVWQSADKIVYSRTLASVSSGRTRIEREFNTDSVRRLKAMAERDITIGGADLAGQAMRAGLIDEVHLFVAPVVVGGGKRALADDTQSNLALLDFRRFAGGFVFLRYRLQHGAA